MVYGLNGWQLAFFVFKKNLASQRSSFITLKTKLINHKP